jgi:ketosteroid isomerase-like protein
MNLRQLSSALLGFGLGLGLVVALVAPGRTAPAAAADAPATPAPATSPPVPAVVTPITGEFPPEVLPLVEAEHAFCRAAAAKGVRDAFLEHLAPDAILFRPEPVNGPEFLRKRPNNPEPRLTWDPTFAEISASGDLGWTMGPWDYRLNADAEPVGFGHFCTVWRKQAGGTWRAVIDHGHDHGRSGAETRSGRRVGGAKAKGAALSAADLAEARRQYAATLQAFTRAIGSDGYTKALAAYGAPDVRAGRDGNPPVVGVDLAGRVFAGDWVGATMTWKPSEPSLSAAGDLGYDYGTVELARPASGGGAPTLERRGFLHVWRREGKAWKLALDVVTALPDEAPPPAAKPEAPAQPPTGGGGSK